MLKLYRIKTGQKKIIFPRFPQQKGALLEAIQPNVTELSNPVQSTHELIETHQRTRDNYTLRQNGCRRRTHHHHKRASNRFDSKQDYKRYFFFHKLIFFIPIFPFMTLSSRLFHFEFLSRVKLYGLCSEPSSTFFLMQPTMEDAHIIAPLYQLIRLFHCTMERILAGHVFLLKSQLLLKKFLLILFHILKEIISYEDYQFLIQHTILIVPNNTSQQIIWQQSISRPSSVQKTPLKTLNKLKSNTRINKQSDDLASAHQSYPHFPTRE